MTGKELRNLQESYFDMYNPERLDEGYKNLDLGKKLRMTGKAIKLRGESERDVKNAARNSGADSTETRVAIERGVKKLKRSENITNTLKSHNPEVAKAKEASNRSPIKRKGNTLTIGMRREQADLYDIILSHLLDEGYADTPEAAERIMVNMGEEWRESIVDEVITEGEKPFPYQKVDKKQASLRPNLGKDGKSFDRAVKMGMAKRRAKEAEKTGGSQQDAGKGWYHGR